ncbi:unnamed protein product [Meloidogyne enterolobii]|uniref:Uncharacterized protein n=1 Tax=Meloidogyne enterolobii TaxID=390850 RepID=A0ACB0XNB5_MELEN
MKKGRKEEDVKQMATEMKKVKGERKNLNKKEEDEMKKKEVEGKKEEDLKQREENEEYKEGDEREMKEKGRKQGEDELNKKKIQKEKKVTKVVDLPKVEEVKSVEFDIKLDKSLESKQEKEDDFIEIISLSKQKRKGEEEENISEELQVKEEPINVSIITTNITFEMPKEPIHSLVNIYSSGRSDEIKEAPIEASASKTLIKISETTKQPELELKPLEIEKKHIGYYEQLIAKKVSKTLGRPLDPFSELVKEVTEYSNKQQLFVSETTKQEEMKPMSLKVEKRHVGYYEDRPQLSIVQEKKFKSLLSQTCKLTELNRFQIDQSVNIYSSGRSEEIKEYPQIEEVSSHKTTKQEEMKLIPLEIEKKNVGYYEQLTAKTAPVTLKRPNEVSDEVVKEVTEYPEIEQQLFVSETFKQSEIKPIPLEVEKKNIGYYEHLKIKEDTKMEERKLEGLVNTTNILPAATEGPIQQFVGIYSSGRSDEQKTTEYPEIEEASLVSHETGKQPEMKPIPLEVERKNVGYYKHITPETNLEESLFKTCKSTEFDKFQIDQFVNIYSSGRSDEVSTSTKMQEQKIEVPSISQVSETKRQLYIDSVPMEVEKKNILSYEHLTIKEDEKNIKPKIKEIEEEKSFERSGLCLGDFIGGKEEMRKKKKVKKEKGRRVDEEKEEAKELEELQQKKPEDEIEQHPVLESEGRKETGKVGEEEEGTLLTERKDEERKEKEEEEQNKVIEMSEVLPSFIEPSKEDKKEKMAEYPKTEQAPSHETTKQSEIKTIPLEVEKKNIGYYEQLKPPTIEEKKPEALEIKTKGFEETSNLVEVIEEPSQISYETTKQTELDFEPLEIQRGSLGLPETEIEKEAESEVPEDLTQEGIEMIPIIKEALIENLPVTSKQSELNRIELKIEDKHEGFYEQLPATISTTKYEEGMETFEGNLKESKSFEKSEPLNAPITTTNIASEMPKEPIHSLVNIYSSGRSDEVKEAPIEESTSETSINVSEITKQEEMKPIPLEIEKKNVGYYEQLMKEDTKIEEMKLESLVDTTNISLEATEEPTQQFVCHKVETSLISHETTKQPEMKLKPLKIENKHVGYYEKLPFPSFVQEKKPEESLFETCKSTELNKSQIDQFVDIYSSGRSDEIKEAPIKFSISEASINIRKTSKQPEMSPIPLEVKKKYIGYYEQLTAKTATGTLERPNDEAVEEMTEYPETEQQLFNI